MIPGRSSRTWQRPTGDEIRTLTPADLRHLHLRDHPRLGPGDAESLVIQSPGLSKWHPASPISRASFRISRRLLAGRVIMA